MLHNKKSDKQMAQLLSKKYHSISEEDFLDIISAFGRYCKKEMLSGNDVKIDKFGTFTTKIKKEMVTKDYKGNKRLKPQMIIPFFKTSKKFRTFINSEDKPNV